MQMNRPMPSAVIIPALPHLDVGEAVNRLGRTFGFVERLRIGNHRFHLQFGVGSRSVTKGGNPNPSFSVMVRVEDIGAHYERIAKSGTQVIKVPADSPYGKRLYTVKDPAGHRWTFAQTLADVDPSTWGGTLLD